MGLCKGNSSNPKPSVPAALLLWLVLHWCHLEPEWMDWQTQRWDWGEMGSALQYQVLSLRRNLSPNFLSTVNSMALISDTQTIRRWLSPGLGLSCHSGLWEIKRARSVNPLWYFVGPSHYFYIFSHSSTFIENQNMAGSKDDQNWVRCAISKRG